VAFTYAVASPEMKMAFLNFQKTYGRVYTSDDEFQRRFQIFQDNMVWASELSSANPLATFGVNQFADLSQEEFANMYLMPNFMENPPVMPPAKDFSIELPPHFPGAPTPNPTNYDWSSAGCITAVKNQGQCGSCWAFSATETIESYFFLAGNSLPTLAPQQIVSCDTGGQDQGCDGGWPSGAYQYVEGAGGMDAESCYPYTAEDGTCTSSQCSPVAGVKSYSSVSGESGLYKQLSVGSGGPVSVCVDASSWQTYTGGILTTCGNQVDHCVQLTGYYNYGQSGAYWNVRNSWAASWGENGYIWIAIGQDLCSIGDYATIVVAGPPSSTSTTTSSSTNPSTSGPTPSSSTSSTNPSTSSTSGPGPTPTSSSSSSSGMVYGVNGNGVF